MALQVTQNIYTEYGTVEPSYYVRIQPTLLIDGSKIGVECNFYVNKSAFLSKKKTLILSEYIEGDIDNGSSLLVNAHNIVSDYLVEMGVNAENITIVDI